MKKFIYFIAGALFAFSITAFAATTVFTDQNTFEDWYDDAVMSLYKKEIITGYSDGSFQASNNVNRAEMAVMMDRLTSFIKNGCVYVESEELLGLEGNKFFLSGDIVLDGDSVYYKCKNGNIFPVDEGEPDE